MTLLTSSGGIVIEYDRKSYAKFKRDMREASQDVKADSAELKRIMGEALDPLADAWRQRLPGSLSGTVKKMPASLTVRAGNKSPHGDHPFLPWVEFGGTVTWYRRPAGGPFKHLALPYGYRMRKVMNIKLPRVPDGRYRQPAIDAGLQETTTKIADGIVEIIDRCFAS